MSNIYVVGERCCCELGEPEIFYTREDAKDYIKTIIAGDVINDFYDELKEAGIDTADTDAIIAWGSERDYCSDDTYMYGSDWHEFTCVSKEIDINYLEEEEREI